VGLIETEDRTPGCRRPPYQGGLQGVFYLIPPSYLMTNDQRPMTNDN